MEGRRWGETGGGRSGKGVPMQCGRVRRDMPAACLNAAGRWGALHASMAYVPKVRGMRVGSQRDVKRNPVRSKVDSRGKRSGLRRLYKWKPVAFRAGACHVVARESCGRGRGVLAWSQHAACRLTGIRRGEVPRQCVRAPRTIRSRNVA